MKEMNIHELIGRYLAGEADHDEETLVKQWISESEKNREEFELHSNVWKHTSIKYKASDSELLFRGILNGIDEHHEKEISLRQEDHNRGVRIFNNPFIKVAAAILLLVGVSYIIYYLPLEPSAPPVEVSVIQKVNPAGQKLKTVLPDGSEVWLNAESILTYPEKFTDGKREVVLEGEAFFSVVRNEQMPFIVKAGNISTTVLGTSFDVRVFDGESTSFVALQEGSVKVSVAHESDHQEHLLEPGQALKYDQANNEIFVEEFDAEKLLAWKDGRLVFKNANLDEISSTLRRWYGVNVEVKSDRSQEWEYNGSFHDKTLEDVLYEIAYSERFNYKFVNPKHIIIELN